MKALSFPILLLLLLQVSLAFADTGLPEDEYVEIESWEQDDPAPVWIDIEAVRSKPDGLLRDITLSMIRFYQRDISTKSVSRCPFYISCSRYAVQAIARKGLFLGLCFFIDRHYYRENRDIYRLYEFREIESGVLRLDDSFFILE